MQTIYHSRSATQTKKIAAQLAKTLTPCLILLKGDLGVGKTTFVQGFIQSLCPQTPIKVQSPTFALARSYETTPPVHHLDLYRLDTGLHSIDIGIEHLLEDPNAFILVEWPDRLPFLEKNADVHITLSEGANSNERAIIVNLPKKSC